jgi:hypothetical protein
MTSLLGRLLFVVLLTVVCLESVAVCQTESATVSGRVTDTTGAIVPGTTVQLQSIERATVHTATTNTAGIYAFSGIQPGQYHMTIRREGFRQIDLVGLVVNVQDHVEKNFQLQVGSISESITVTGGAPLVNAESPAVSTVIDRNFAGNLPLNGRSFNTLLQLVPGVLVVPTGNFEPGQFTVNGQRTNANNLQIDGVSANFGTSAGDAGVAQAPGSVQAFNAVGGTSSLVSVDALQEFRVQTSSFAPEYGRTPGGQISIVTRSGSNEFHGGVFNYFRNDKLDANDWFANAAGLGKPLERQNDFGGFFGGPVFHDKTFFFFSYEGLRLRLPQTVKSEVPSLGLRASAPPAIRSLLDSWPLPTSPADPSSPDVAQFAAAYSNRIGLNAASIRLDHTLNSKVTMFGRFNYAPSTNVTRALSDLSRLEMKTVTSTFGATLQLKDGLIDDVRANYSRQSGENSFTLDSFGGAIPPDSHLLLPAPLLPSDSAASFGVIGVPTIRLGLQAHNPVSQVNLSDDIAWTAGVHQVKFGVDYRDTYLHQNGQRAFLNYFNFNGVSGLLSGKTDLLQLLATRNADLLFRSLSAFGQDTWRPISRLVLTYGLRWDYNPPPTGRNGTTLQKFLNLDSPGLIRPGKPGTSLWNPSYFNVAPRFGFTYSLNAKEDFVLHGGGGLFYDLGLGASPGLVFSAPNEVANFLTNEPLPVVGVTSLIPPFSLQAPYSIIQAFEPNVKSPYSWHWNASIEKAIAASQAVSVAYVGQQGRRLLRSELTFQPSPLVSGPLVITRNADSSRYDALQAQFRRRRSSGVQALLNYTWSHCIDSGSSDGTFGFPVAVLPLRGERGSCDFDVRQNFTGAVTYDIPARLRMPFVGPLVRNWSVDGVFQARTGLPITVTTQQVTIDPIAPFPTRPDVVPGVPVWIGNKTAPGGKILNSAAFVIPSQVRQGNLGRNSITGFGATEVNLSVSRKFCFTESTNLQFRADLFNVFNHPNFSNPDSTLDDGAIFGFSTQMLNQGLGGLGAIYQLGGPRSVQLSLKLLF